MSCGVDAIVQEEVNNISATIVQDCREISATFSSILSVNVPQELLDRIEALENAYTFSDLEAGAIPSYLIDTEVEQVLQYTYSTFTLYRRILYTNNIPTLDIFYEDPVFAIIKKSKFI